MVWTSSTSTRSARLPPGWAKLRLRVMERDSWTCRIGGPGCTRVATECDHIIRGDNHDPTNLQAACKHCHASKTARENHAARQPRRRGPERHPGLL